ncbi:redoxin family protein [Shinella sp. AETb1-6]|jgi:thiol-disulfide isomerase/thioredoxin|uniref:TlpA disulfide reductase family protein n=1 Tax=Shinella sumterensis TaxID=1967501 RepID=A0AA50H5L7_9HYPH|nr:MULTISPECIES: TlpA disulfide reductase family protein [Shinella]MCD1265575.1 redoxin family protein [Shinella sumterensis]MXN52988.1 redoxin family protein [Shinella sp. AETb1-6]TFE98223.1 sodium:dicarboxylate symporter [Shinella sumterensis]WLR97383.1 TlpA disulfide reductase family protein [Shinella sumterensis]
MSVKKTLGLPAGKLIAIAGLAGLLAGGAAIYVKESLSGNATGAVASADPAACPLAAARAEAITPFSKGQVAAMRTVDEHRPLPELVFDGPDGKKKTIADFAGKTLLVNLWATWCVPCREEMPALNALEKDLGSDKFEVVAINIDTGDDEKPKTFLDETKVHELAYYRDASMGVFNTLKKEGLAFGLPVTLLMDDKGCLISAMNGPAAWDSEDAKALINAALAGPKS